MPAGPVVGEATPVCAQRRSTAGHAPARLGLTDTWGKGPARSWASSEQTNGPAVAEGKPQDEASQQHRPEVDESPAPKVGEEVQVWWSAEAQWFDGVVDGKRKEPKKRGRWLHHVTYIDGDERWHHLPAMVWTIKAAATPTKQPKAALANKRDRPSPAPLPSPQPKIMRTSSDCAKPGNGNQQVPAAIDDPQAHVHQFESNPPVSDELHEDASSLLALCSPGKGAANEDSADRRVVLAQLFGSAGTTSMPQALVTGGPMGPHDQCERHPQCTRGSRHHGKGGKCSLDRSRPLPNGLVLQSSSKGHYPLASTKASTKARSASIDMLACLSLLELHALPSA